MAATSIIFIWYGENCKLSDIIKYNSLAVKVAGATQTSADIFLIFFVLKEYCYYY